MFYNRFKNGAAPILTQPLIMLLDAVYVEAGTRYCGASQILTHVKPYWEYATAFSSERRALKAISKAHTLAAYESAVASLRQ